MLTDLERRAAETGRVYCLTCEISLQRIDGGGGRYECSRCGSTYVTYSTDSMKLR